MTAVFATLSTVQILTEDLLHNLSAVTRCQVPASNLHPLASSALDNWIYGLIRDGELVRFASLVNSENLNWALCLVQG